MPFPGRDVYRKMSPPRRIADRGWDKWLVMHQAWCWHRRTVQACRLPGSASRTKGKAAITRETIRRWVSRWLSLQNRRKGSSRRRKVLTSYRQLSFERQSRALTTASQARTTLSTHKESHPPRIWPSQIISWQRWIAVWLQVRTSGGWQLLDCCRLSPKSSNIRAWSPNLNGSSGRKHAQTQSM